MLELVFFWVLLIIKNNKLGAKFMNCEEKWILIGEDQGELNFVKSNKKIRWSRSDLNIEDILIGLNWNDYAKGIADPSVN